MFYAMAFFPSFENQYCVRSLKLRGYKTAEQAKEAIIRSRVDGYVKRVGHNVPVWSNVK